MNGFGYAPAARRAPRAQVFNGYGSPDGLGAMHQHLRRAQTFSGFGDLPLAPINGVCPSGYVLGSDGCHKAPSTGTVVATSTGIPIWGWALGGVALAGLGFLAYKKFHH